jgi:hypothetical protein
MKADALSHSIHYEDICYDKHRMVLTQQVSSDRFRHIRFLGFRAYL